MLSPERYDRRKLLSSVFNSWLGLNFRWLNAEMEVSTATFLCKPNITLETLSNPACNCDSEREWDLVYHLKPSVIALLSFIVSSRTRKYFERPRCINCKSRLRDGGPDVWNDDWPSHSSRPCCKRSSAEPASLNKHFLCGHFILNIPILRKWSLRY